MPGRLDGKVCIITGAASGIGQAIARLFAREGSRVVVADIDGTAAERTVAEIAAASGEAVARAVDITDAGQARSLADGVVNDFGTIDILVNNAGIGAVGMLHETPEEVWERVIRVNVNGTYLVSKFVVPHMIARRSGVIVNMASTIASVGLPNRAAYGASKGAILALTRCMQVDYGQYGIRVNVLQPGSIFTPMLERVIAESQPSREEYIALTRSRQLTPVLGTPEHVAAAALFLASDDARFIMATGLFVDGGVTGGRGAAKQGGE